MRGLKRSSANILKKKTESHLLQMRGLKHKLLYLFRLIVKSRIFYRCVDWNLPRQQNRIYDPQVASFTDAWIETYSLIPTNKSPEVASFTDAWIETTGKNHETTRHLVASFTDAWIETGCIPIIRALHIVASFTDAWIETQVLAIRVEDNQSRIFYRCVDWNTYTALGAATNHSRIFYRCVDWNIFRKVFGIICKVASFTDAWIETHCDLFYSWSSTKSHLLQMRGLKHFAC